MYRILLIITFILILAWIFWRIRNQRLQIKTWQLFFQEFISIKEIFKLENVTVLQSARITSYQLVLILFLIMAASGFLPIIIAGGHLNGVLLIIHVTVAPIFCVFYALSIILWAHAQRFQSKDWTYLLSLKGEMKNKVDTEIKEMFWQKVYFWLFMLASLPAIISIILSMYPLFGTEGQDFLLQLHRYSTLLMFILFSLHILTLSEIPDQSKNKGKIA